MIPSLEGIRNLLAILLPDALTVLATVVTVSKKPGEETQHIKTSYDKRISPGVRIGIALDVAPELKEKLDKLREQNAALRDGLERLIPPIENNNMPGSTEMKRAKAALALGKEGA